MPATAKACACRSGSSSGLLSDVTDCREPKDFASAWQAQPTTATRGRPSLRLLRLDQDECNATGLGSPVDPGMVGALLDQHVAGLEMDLAVVEQHVDLALHDDGVVNGERAVHQRVARRQTLF